MRCGCAPAHRRVPDATRPFAGVHRTAVRVGMRGTPGIVCPSSMCRFRLRADPAARGRNRGVDRSGRVRSRSLPPWTKPKLARIGADASLRVYTAVHAVSALRSEGSGNGNVCGGSARASGAGCTASVAVSRSEEPPRPGRPTESSACWSDPNRRHAKRTTICERRSRRLLVRGAARYRVGRQALAEPDTGCPSSTARYHQRCRSCRFGDLRYPGGSPTR